MSKKNKHRILTVIFITAVIFSLFSDNLFATQAELKTLKELEEKEKTAAPAQVIVRPGVEYKAEGLRDPFKEDIIEEKVATAKPQAHEIPQTPLPALRVQGLIWGGSFSQAIINDKVVKVGDTIDGARITDIDKNGITVFFEGREYNLSSPAAAAFPSKGN